MFSTVVGASLLARATASYQTADADKAAVNGMPTAVETHTTEDTRPSFDNLDDQYKHKRQIDDSRDEQNHVGNPLARLASDGHLSTNDEVPKRDSRKKLTVGVKITSKTATTIRATQKRKLIKPMLAP
jgi:hypothetical protein